MVQFSVPDVKGRTYLPGNFKIEGWEDLQPHFDELLNRPIDNLDDLFQWFRDRSELESCIGEDAGWRYIRMTCYTENKEYEQAYVSFISEIEPKIAPYANKLNVKALNSAFRKDLPSGAYQIMIRHLEKDVRLFREENIPLKVEIQKHSKEYATITGAMTIEMDKEEMTLQQAAVLLESTQRTKREEAYLKIANRRFEDHGRLDQLFTDLVKLRHQVALNAGFDNFRDYMFESLGRFDYTPEACFAFQDSVREVVVPLIDELAVKRKDALKIDELKPWDKAVDPSGLPPLKPFKHTEELTDRTIECFNQVHPFLGECMALLAKEGRLDLQSRKGKAPGGYNYPLPETGIPFIFMNATSTLRDLVTLLHEGGHAVHSIITRDLELVDFQHTPSEVAELASMSMELLTMDHWDLFFENEDDLLRAKRQHLEQILHTLPWVALIDKFQHWIYENPGHSAGDRAREWIKIFNAYSDQITSWDGLEDYKKYNWQKQLHLYEVPFYYIEYGIAQLGALGVWKNYKRDKTRGLNLYLTALKAGHTQTIPDIYDLAGIRFDFSKSHIHQLISFVSAELDQL